jgi:cell division protein FtsZ
LFEINEAASLVAEAAHPDANIIFGAVIDDTLGDEVRITVIAAGFDSGQLPYKKVEPRRDSAVPPIATAGVNGVGAINGASTGVNGSTTHDTAVDGGWALPSSAVGRSTVGLDEDLDIPDFLK